jgi:hypothetical protein
VTLEYLPPILGIGPVLDQISPQKCRGSCARSGFCGFWTPFSPRPACYRIVYCMYVHAHGVIHCIVISPFPSVVIVGNFLLVVPGSSVTLQLNRSPHALSTSVGCPVYSFLITRNELPHPSIGLQSRLFHWAILLVVLSKGILAGMWRYVGSGCVGSSRNNPGRKGWSNPGSPGDGSWL